MTLDRNVLLTGRPGIGKTTVIIRLAELLQGRPLAGFYTEETREHGKRTGFRAVTFSQATAMLAHVGLKGSPKGARVGRYGVDVPGFEQLVLPELARPAELLLIDEIGKMECFSPRFVEAVRSLLDGPAPVVATVALRGGGFIAEAKARPDVAVHEVTQSNRDELPRHLAAAVRRTGALDCTDLHP